MGKKMTRDFSYTLRSSSDQARLLQQQGITPPPHEFQAHPYIPHMCGVPGCYATLQGDKPWHIATIPLGIRESWGSDGKDTQ